MGRPKIYKSDEERLAAARERSTRYYERKRLSICEKRRLKYEEKKEQKDKDPKKKDNKKAQKEEKLKTKKAGRRPPAQITDEEQKLKNRLKSARYYQRKKSEIQSKRQNGRVNGHPRCDSKGSTTKIPFRTIWEQQLAYHASRLPELLGNESLGDLLERLSRQFLKDGDTSALTDAFDPFEDLLNSLRAFQGQLYIEVGAGAETEQTAQMRSDVQDAIYYLKDLAMFALSEGRARFLESYLHDLLAYQIDSVV